MISLFRKKTTGEVPVPGTEEALTAHGIYQDSLAGMKQQIVDLRRNNALWQSVAVLAVVGLVLLLPLRKRVPYFFEVDSSTGRVALTNRVAEELKVTDSNTSYFLRLWVARLVTINAATLKDGLPSAYRWTRAGAQKELDDWVDQDKTAERIAKVSGLTREILGVPTVSYNEEKTVAFVDFVWVEKVQGVERERKRKLLTLDFGLVPPKRADEDPDNPLGIAITHFTLQDQVSR